MRGRDEWGKKRREGGRVRVFVHCDEGLSAYFR